MQTGRGGGRAPTWCAVCRAFTGSTREESSLRPRPELPPVTVTRIRQFLCVSMYAIRTGRGQGNWWYKRNLSHDMASGGCSRCASGCWCTHVGWHIMPCVTTYNWDLGRPERDGARTLWLIACFVMGPRLLVTQSHERSACTGAEGGNRIPGIGRQ